MSTITKERTTWVCDNCHAQSSARKKRCADCGTTRY